MRLVFVATLCVLAVPWTAHGDSSESGGDAAVLLEWKASLPPGDCLGCQGGPVFRNWTADNELCDWNDDIRVPGEQGTVSRGVTRCSHHNHAVMKLCALRHCPDPPTQMAFTEI